MDYSPPGSSVHGISQARVLEWVAISFSRGSSFADPWMEPASPAWQVGSLPLTHLRSLCYFLLHSKMNQPYICMYPLPFGLPSHSGHHSALFWTESGETESVGCGGTKLEGWTVPGRKMLGQREQLRCWNEPLYFNIYQIEKPKGPTEYHRED